MNKTVLCIAIVLILLFTVGCNTGESPSDPSQPDSSTAVPKDNTDSTTTNDKRLYSLWLSETQTWVFDEDGNEVQKKEDSADFIELIDPLTEVAKYQYQTKYEDTGLRDQWDYPIVKTLHALYDMEGKQLLDWEEKDYSPAFGDYILRQDRHNMMGELSELSESYKTALYHVPTGVESYEGTFSILNMGTDFLLCDNWRLPMGILDSNGKEVSGFPPPKTYYNSSSLGDYFTASSDRSYEETGNNQTFLLDRSFKEMYAYPWISATYGNMPTGLFIYKDGTETGLIDPPKGVLFSIDDNSIEYFDKELAIVQQGYYCSEKEPINAALVTVDHKELVGGFIWLIPVQPYDDKSPSPKFIGAKDQKVVLIDRQGKEMASSEEIPYLFSVSAIYDGLYSYYVENDNMYGTGLLDENLNIVIPAGTYSAITAVPGFYEKNEQWSERTETILLVGSKDFLDTENSYLVSRIDIFDHTGRIIIDNATNVFDGGPNRIALQRGFDAGLIDWDGNWIVKKSIFNNFADD